MSKQTTGLVQSLLEPEQTDANNDGVDKGDVGDERDEVHEELLVSLQVLEIDRVQTRLGGRAGAEEEGVYRRDVAVRVEDKNAEETAEYDPNILHMSADGEMDGR
jgi:hypothetical protein